MPVLQSFADELCKVAISPLAHSIAKNSLMGMGFEAAFNPDATPLSTVREGVGFGVGDEVATAFARGMGFGRIGQIAAGMLGGSFLARALRKRFADKPIRHAVDKLPDTPEFRAIKQAAATKSILTPQSSNVSGYSYDPETSSLNVTFKSGGTYTYKGVPASALRALARNKSVGKTINKIKATAEYEKIGAPLTHAQIGQRMQRRNQKLLIDAEKTPVDETDVDMTAPYAAFRAKMHAGAPKLAAMTAFGEDHYDESDDAGWKDKLPGGLADDKFPHDFDFEALDKGIKVELEHTKDRRLAMEIAMDHLTEDGSYYDKLEKMEKKSHIDTSRRVPTKIKSEAAKAGLGVMPYSKSSNSVYVPIVEDGVMVGMLNPRERWLENAGKKVREHRVGDIYISPEHRGKGYASKAIREYFADKKSGSAVILDSNADSRRAFERAGFSRTDRTKEISGKPAHVYRLDKTAMLRERLREGASHDAEMAAQSLKEERQAIKDYGHRLKQTKNQPLHHALAHALKEERSHAHMFKGVLNKQASSIMDAFSIRRRQMEKSSGIAKKQRAFDGLTLKIEQEPGDIREGVSKSGHSWSRMMHASYGYVAGTGGMGADGEAIDVYLAKDPVPGADVYQVSQNKKDGGFDEHKYMLGYPDAETAKREYLRHMPEWAFGSIRPESMDDFRSKYNKAAS